jgi:hypothetical protein
MNRQAKTKRWILAAAACAVLAADASTAAEHAGKSAPKSGEAGKSAARGIDLIRPDDGYANLRRRETRSSLVAAGQKKKLQVVPPVAVTPHQLSAARTPAEPSRNSAGIAFPVSTGVGKPDSIRTMPGGPVNTSLAKNSVGMSLGEIYRPETHRLEIHRPETHLAATGMMAPVTGINGTTMGHAGAGGIGGPAKDRSAINGSALRPRF